MDISCLNSCWAITDDWKMASEDHLIGRSKCIYNCFQGICYEAGWKSRAQGICILFGLLATFQATRFFIRSRNSIAESIPLQHSNPFFNLDLPPIIKYVKRGQQELDIALRYSALAVGLLMTSVLASWSYDIDCQYQNCMPCYKY